MTLSVVRAALKTAVEQALDDDAWLGGDTIPVTPDDQSYWVNYPNDARRTTLTAGLEYQISVRFAIGLNDPDVAQEILNDLYEPALWFAIEAYETDAWVGITVVNLDEPFQLPLMNGAVMLAVDMPIDIYT